MSRAAESFREWYAPVRADVFKLCEALRFCPTKQQRELLLRVQRGVMGLDKNRIAVKSGQGAGKTTALGVAVLWLALRNEGASIPFTAPTMRQCKTWLTEVGRTVDGADPWVKKLVSLTKTKLIIAGRDDWGAHLITATKPEAAQGEHEKNMSIVVDEASGVAKELLEQWNGTFTNRGTPGNFPIFLLAGNPNTRDSYFFRCFNDLRDWFQTQTINTEHCEIVSEEGPEFIAAAYGKDSDVYRVRVLGEFPHMDPQSVMSSEDLEACTKTSMVACSRLSSAKQFGIDLSRFGGDEATIYRRSGNAIVQFWIGVKQEPTHVIDRAFLMQTTAGWKNEECIYVPDATGMGQGVLGKLYDAKRRVFEFHNGGTSSTRGYGNRVTEAYFQLAKLVKARRCYIPNDNRLIMQLSNRKYHTDRHGDIVLETKDDFIKRGFDSPDRADGLVQAFFDKVVADTRVASAGEASRPRVGAVGRVIR